MASSPHVKKTKIQTGEDHKAGSIYKGEQLLHQKTVLHYTSVPCSVQDVDTKNNIVTLGPIYNVHLNRQYATKGHVANTQLLKLCQVRST